MLCYERETYLFVNELSRNKISTLAKFRISSRDLHIEKGRHSMVWYGMMPPNNANRTANSDTLIRLLV